MCRARGELESELLKLSEHRSSIESRVEQLQQEESDHRLKVKKLAEEIKHRQKYASQVSFNIPV